MKKLIFALLTVCLLTVLSACGCDDGEDAGLVFVNHSDAAIVEVVVDFTDQTSGMRNANSSPLKRGESFGFEAGEYPVTVIVYDRPFENFGQKELARATIDRAPAEGERWYVIAQDGADGLVLSVGARWPEGV